MTKDYRYQDQKFKSQNKNKIKNKNRFLKLIKLMWSVIWESFTFTLYVIFKSIGLVFMGLAQKV